MVSIRPGIGMALASAVLFGASTPLAKALLGNLDPWLLAGVLYLGSGLGLGAARIAGHATGFGAVETPLRPADLPWLGAIVLVGGVLGPLLLMFGLARSEAASASLLLNLEGLATMVIAWVVFGENVDRRILIGAVAILAGAIVLSWQGGFSLGWGGLLIVGACVAWGVDNNLTRKLSAADPVQIAMTKGLAAGTANLALALLHGAGLPGVGVLLAGALVGLFGYGVSLVLFVLGLRHLGAARTGAYFSTAPFIGAVLAVLLFAEPVTASLLVAGALMAVGVYLHVVEDHVHEHAHEAGVHEHLHEHDEHHRHTHAPGDPAGAPHAHVHAHARLIHRHPHYPDLHHRHSH